MDKDSLVSEVMKITFAMLAEAQSGHWDKLASMELARKVHLDHYFVEKVDNTHASQAVKLVQEVLAADKKLIVLVNKMKNEYSQEHSLLKEGHKAMQAYQVNQK